MRQSLFDALTALVVKRIEEQPHLDLVVEGKQLDQKQALWEINNFTKIGEIVIELELRAIRHELTGRKKIGA